MRCPPNAAIGEAKTAEFGGNSIQQAVSVKKSRGSLKRQPQFQMQKGILIDRSGLDYQEQ